MRQCRHKSPLPPPTCPFRSPPGPPAQPFRFAKPDAVGLFLPLSSKVAEDRHNPESNHGRG
ncbi:hypothetical protein BKA80DRAFT_285647 [Phyllosticta citrichinensis]